MKFIKISSFISKSFSFLFKKKKYFAYCCVLFVLARIKGINDLTSRTNDSQSSLCRRHHHHHCFFLFCLVPIFFHSIFHGFVVRVWVDSSLLLQQFIVRSLPVCVCFIFCLVFFLLLFFPIHILCSSSEEVLFCFAINEKTSAKQNAILFARQ